MMDNLRYEKCYIFYTSGNFIVVKNSRILKKFDEGHGVGVEV
jgi:hypothetical protein